MLERGLLGFPQYSPLGEMETWVLPAVGQPTGRLVPAVPRDIPELVHLINESGRAAHFSPHLTAAWFASGSGGLRIDGFLVRREGGALRACLALWDQRAFKQVRVQGYRAPLNILRAPWNLWAWVRGGVRLPAPGNRLEACFLAFASWAAPEWEEAALDVREALAQASLRGIGVALLGLPVGHPLGPRLRKGRAPWIYRTCIEGVRWPDTSQVVLDLRPVHPEIALL